MSYEGYVQAICANGHYFATDCYDERGCPTCGAQSAWRNDVDDTNCESYGEIPYQDLADRFRIRTQVVETCPTCNHRTVKARDVFRIPTVSETEGMRCWRPGYGGTPLVPLKEAK